MPHPPQGRLLAAAAIALTLTIVGSANPGKPTADASSFAPAGPPDLPARRDRVAPATEKVDVVQLADGRQVLPGHVLVGFRQNSAATSLAIRQRQGALHGGREPQRLRTFSSGLELHAVPADVSLDQALREYRADPQVAFAEPDVLRPVQAMPNDSILAYQWNLLPIRAVSGWSVSQGRTSVRVAMVDTGIFDDGSQYLAPDGKPGHPDLRGKVDMNKDFTTSDPTLQDPDDWMGHGTHTAGIAAAAANNALGIAGVGYDTHLLNAKACKSGSCADSWVIDAMSWSVQNGAKVISLTGASPTACPSTIQAAIDDAWNHDVVVVAPAGNAASPQITTPAGCNHVVSVASTNSDDTLSSFSEYGPWVTVAAPGGQDAAGNLILSTGYTGLYEYREGTSMAAPVVSGLAALVWASPYGTSASAVVQRITSTADRIGGTGTLWQAGRVNVAAALGAIATSSIPSAAPITTQVPIPAGWGRPPGLAWDSRASMPTPRSRIGIGALGSTLYAVGGANQQWQALSTVEAYDSVANTWRSLPPLPGVTAAPGVAGASNGRLYAAGGTQDGVTALNTLAVYDPATNGWSSAAPMPTPRWGMVLQAGADGKLYAIGGRNSSTVLPTVEAYDPVSNTWSARAPMPTPRVFAASTLGPTNSRIYVAGGADTSYTPLAAFEVYDPATNTWVIRPGLPTPRSSLGLASVPNAHIYAAGGDGSGTVSNVDEYNPYTQSWSAAVGMPRARGGGFGYVTLQNGVQYAIGGWTNGTLVTQLDAASLIAAKP